MGINTFIHILDKNAKNITTKCHRHNSTLWDTPRLYPRPYIIFIKI